MELKPHAFVFVSCACALALPALAAQSYWAVNSLRVYPITKDTYEVIEDRGAGARGIWCAAADYVQAAGLDRVRLRMYVLEERGPSRAVPGRFGVVFTINPDEKLRETPPSYSVSVNRRGENLTVGHALNFCDAFINDLFDRF